MSTIEGERVIDEYTGSKNAVEAVRLTLSQYFDQAVEADMRPSRTAGKLQIDGYVPAVLGIDDHTTDYDDDFEQHEVEGGIEWFKIRRDMETGAISYASMQGKLPASLSKEELGSGTFSANSWQTKMYFPPKHDPEETQKLVVDSWQTPLAQLTLMENAYQAAHTPERLAAYGEFARMIFERKDGAGIPLGAVAISHTVLGRGYSVAKEDAAKVNADMDVFGKGVQNAIDWVHLIRTTNAAECQ